MAVIIAAGIYWLIRGTAAMTAEWTSVICLAIVPSFLAVFGRRLHSIRRQAEDAALDWVARASRLGANFETGWLSSLSVLKEMLRTTRGDVEAEDIERVILGFLAMRTPAPTADDLNRAKRLSEGWLHVFLELGLIRAAYRDSKSIYYRLDRSRCRKVLRVAYQIPPPGMP